MSDRLFAAVDALAALLGGIGEVKEPSDYAEDVSDGADEGQDRGSVSLCINRGDVDADTNVGGVVGSVSIDLSFDREDELNLSSVLAGGAKYLIYATVRECSNYASVHAGKSAAGGTSSSVRQTAYVEGRALPWGWIAGGCALVLLAGAAALLLLRRKKKNTDGHNGGVMYKEVKEAPAGEETAAVQK